MHETAPSSTPRCARRNLLGSAVAVCVLLATAAAAAEVSTIVEGEGVQLDCARPTTAQLSCDFRFLSPGDPGAPTARVDGIGLPTPKVTPFSADPGVVAALILVDTSVAGNFSAVPMAARDLRILTADLPARVNLGLGTFAGDLKVLAPLGGAREALAEAAQGLEADESATELYRNTLQAVRLLGRYEARRRALFLFSHGMADDRAYFHDDVVKAAREHNVAIFGVGYAAGPQEAASLQRLRRLAEETGGLYLSASGQQPLNDLDAEFAARALALLESGGRLSVDLSAAQAQDQGATEPDVALAWGDTRSGVSARVPLEAMQRSIGAGPGAARLVSKPPARTGTTGPTPDTPPPVSPVHHDGVLSAYWPWMLLVLILLAAGGGAGYLYWKRRPAKRKPEPLWAETVKLSARSFAFLEAQDDERTRHPLTGEVFRLGRHADNELPVPDPSMSRHHAEIRHEPNGQYVIRDLESLNGVYVNGKKCRSAALSNGDLIELGDVTLKFTVVAAHDRKGAEGTGDGTVTPFRPAGKRTPRSS